VRAVAQKDLSRPDDGFVDASDPSSVMTGTLNRIYGVPARGAAAAPKRNAFGFITD
jgi:pilus assembly protein CpaC